MYLPTVYTSLGGLCLEKADVASIKELGAYAVEWITESALTQ